MSEKYKNLKVKELQDLLQKHGLSLSGKKEELIERLIKHEQQTVDEFASLDEEFGDLEEFDDSKLALDDIEDSIAPEEDVLEEGKEEKTTSTTTTTTDTPIVKPNSNFKFTPIVFEKKAGTEVAPVAAKAVEEPKKEIKLPVVPPKVTDDAERALERAKRFGIQLNDTAKKDIRAQRFGIPAAAAATATPASPKPVKSSPVKKGIDPEVLKKRAERFGLAKTSSPKEKPAPIVNGKVPVTLDPAEEEKKRKRAERFQQSEDAKKQKTE